MPERILTASHAYHSVPLLVPIPPTPEHGKENASRLIGQITPAVVDKMVIPRYAHPHSPNPSHVSQFNSPKLTAASGYSPNSFAAALSPSPSPVLSHVVATGIHHATTNHFMRPMPATGHSHEPSVVQLLAQQPADRAYHGLAPPSKDRDSTMANATGVVSWRKGQGFKLWEKARLESGEVRRKADVAQLCESILALCDLTPPVFFDHYFDLLTYLQARKGRLATFKTSVRSRPGLTSAEATAEWMSYRGRERVLLRKRRTKTKLDQFHIITQVGQGGYGEVYLAKRKDSHQVVALKKMRKRTLLKMDEVRSAVILL